MSAPLPDSIRPQQVSTNDVIHAISELESRGLIHATKWLSEFLQALPEDDTNDIEAPKPDLSAQHSRFVLAKSHFDLKEYRRAAHVLKGFDAPKCQFLRLYSLFLAGEKKKQEDSQRFASNVRSPVFNLEIAAIRAELANAYTRGALDAFGLYLYGIVLRESEDPTLRISRSSSNALSEGQIELSRETALHLLIEAVEAFPWNWSAWLDLGSVIHDKITLNVVLQRCKPHICKQFFEAHVLAQLGQIAAAISAYEQLEAQFPTLVSVKLGLAQAWAAYGHFKKSVHKFSEARLADPFNLEGLESYATVLHEIKDPESLCRLAMDATSTSKWTTQTCLIVARFHLSQGADDMAQKMANHALSLDTGLVRAWEYLAEPMRLLVDLQWKIAFLNSAQLLMPHSAALRAHVGAAYVFAYPWHAYYHLWRASSDIPLLHKDDWILIAYILDALATHYPHITELSKLIKSKAQDPVALTEAHQSLKDKLMSFLLEYSIHRQKTHPIDNKASQPFDPTTESPHQSMLIAEANENDEMSTSVRTPTARNITRSTVQMIDDVNQSVVEYEGQEEMDMEEDDGEDMEMAMDDDV